MATYRVIPATVEHARAMAPNMRIADQEEVMASHGYDPLSALLVSINNSAESWSGLADDEIGIMFGVCPTDNGAGMIWLLGTDLVFDHKAAFLRRSKSFVNCACSCYTALYNFVDARNEASIEWLRWLGFSIGEAQPMGPAGMPFLPVWKGTV